MSINTIAFLSNTITRPFKRFLSDYTIVHYPLDTVIDQLHLGVKEDLLVILLDPAFFGLDADRSFRQLHNAIKTFREDHSTKIIINTITDNFYEIHITDTFGQEMALMELNRKIVSLSEEFADLAILDLTSLVKEFGLQTLINERNRYLFQTPFTKKAVSLLSEKIKENIILMSTSRIKAIAVDADNTLWGGIVGEDGIDGIKIDQNYPGIVYTKFQRHLKALKQSGIILILLSKNDETLVHEVFEKKTMPLSLDDFVATSIDWSPKSENLDAILKMLNLSRSSIIFFDDSDSEIAEMRMRMGIPCYQMDVSDPLKNMTLLESITELKTLHITNEDTQKTRLYQDEKSRLDLSESLGSRQEYIASLHIEITVTCNNTRQLDRITQLVNKTNQFNLTTRRYERAEIEVLMSQEKVYALQVKDDFGDMGLVGVFIIKDSDIDSFLMSCRVLGRGIEERVLTFIRSKHPSLSAKYIPTAKNALVEDFYEKNGFELMLDESEKHYRSAKKVDINKDIKVIDAT